MTSSSYSHSLGPTDTTLVDNRSQHPYSQNSNSGDAASSLSSSRLYHIYHTTFMHDYMVSDAEKKHVYYVDNSSLTPRKPDLTFHMGSDKHAPVAGVCKFLHFSRHFKLGLGDPQLARDMVWEDLVCQNLRLTKYRWEMSVPTVGGGFERRSFLWKRTHSVAVDGESASILSARNYKLVDEPSGQIVAVFTSNTFKSFRKSGKLQVVANCGPHFDLLVLITLLAIYEKQRRRNTNGGGGGGGGGGG